VRQVSSTSKWDPLARGVNLDRKFEPSRNLMFRNSKKYTGQINGQ
jgi:hypothetical protein